jgi:hypothetical protein
MSTLRVSLLQQPLLWHDGAANRARFAELLRPLAGAGHVPVLLTVELPREPLAQFREKFPAHLDADRFTLEL